MSSILIVDDEKSIRLSVGEMLKREGFEVQVAPDAQTALELLQDSPVDVVLTDIIMPRITGIELMALIREVRHDVQVIVMTGEPTVETAVKAVQCGANDYLSKPIAKDSLLRTVRHAAAIKALSDDRTRLEQQTRQYQRDLEQMVEARTQALQETMRSVIFVLSSVVELRDPYTAGHQRKVGNLAAAIARKLNRSEKFIDTLRIAGYIHDIGKIVIPTEILSKPGELSKLEMLMIRNHPQQGYEMLKKANLPNNIPEIIFQHHERLDGSGYPRALKGRDISDEAKILIVADVVEAMISHRPYRPALGIDAALAEVRSMSGIHYQPEAVEACLELCRSDRYALDDREHQFDFAL